MLSVGMAFAVLIDASLVRMVLVSSVMTLLGAHAWWMPRWLDRVIPQLRIEGSAAAAEGAGRVAPRHLSQLVPVSTQFSRSATLPLTRQ
jgi:putative drug exporter of the RND superfamily